MTPTADNTRSRPIRLLAGILYGAMGLSAAELELLGHYEDRWQLVPIVLLVCGLLLQPVRRRRFGGRIWMALMMVFAASGIAGLVQHFRSNAEFELELSPGLGGLELVWQSLRGATPALAPATMIGLGLLGFALAWSEQSDNRNVPRPENSMTAKRSVYFFLTVFVAAAATAQVGRNQSVVEPNRATKDELVALPHVDADLADVIIEARPILTATNLDALVSKHLDGEKASALYAKLFVPIDLNSAPREEILLVPGVGPRMAHEFEEYRPYRGLAEFRREIGKYVDVDEVARLEQYVFVPIDLNKASDEDILSIPGIGRRMLHEFKEYRPYSSLEQFRREIGKYVDDGEVARLERYVRID